jgi:hypothetical protein
MNIDVRAQQRFQTHLLRARLFGLRARLLPRALPSGKAVESLGPVRLYKSSNNPKDDSMSGS